MGINIDNVDKKLMDNEKINKKYINKPFEEKLTLKMDPPSPGGPSVFPDTGSESEADRLQRRKFRAVAKPVVVGRDSGGILDDRGTVTPSHF